MQIMHPSSAILKSVLFKLTTDNLLFYFQQMLIIAHTVSVPLTREILQNH